MATLNDLIAEQHAVVGVTQALMRKTPYDRNIGMGHATAVDKLSTLVALGEVQAPALKIELRGLLDMQGVRDCLNSDTIDRLRALVD